VDERARDALAEAGEPDGVGEVREKRPVVGDPRLPRVVRRGRLGRVDDEQVHGGEPDEPEEHEHRDADGAADATDHAGPFLITRAQNSFLGDNWRRRYRSDASSVTTMRNTAIAEPEP